MKIYLLTLLLNSQPIATLEAPVHIGECQILGTQWYYWVNKQSKAPRALYDYECLQVSSIKKGKTL